MEKEPQPEEVCSVGSWQGGEKGEEGKSFSASAGCSGRISKGKVPFLFVAPSQHVFAWPLKESSWH